MDENVVFQQEGTPVQPTAQPEPQPQVPVVTNPETVQTVPANTLEPSLPPLSSSSLIPTLIKAFLGIVLLVILFFVLSRLVLPLLKPKNEKVTLVYWGLWEGENVMKAVISDFEKDNKNIAVDYKKQDIKQYRDRLMTQTQNKNGPDLFAFHNTWLPMVEKILLPLPNDVISSKDFQAEYYPTVKEDLVKNGGLYGLPSQIDTLALFINTDMFKAAGIEAPKTWDDFATLSRKLTVKDESGKIKTAGAAMGTFDNITHAPDIISLLFVQNGASIKNLAQNLQNAADALSFYSSFANKDSNVWDDSLDPSSLAFAKGNLGMYFGYSWDIFTMKAINPELNFAVYEVPHLPNRNMTIASYWAAGVSIKTKHQKEALLFMKFLAKKETQQKLFTESAKTRLFGQLYARVDLANLLKDNQLIYPFVSQAPNAVSSFFASDTFDNGLNSQMNSYLGNTVRSVLDNTSPQSAVETLSAGVSQVLKQYGQ